MQAIPLERPATHLPFPLLNLVRRPAVLFSQTLLGLACLGLTTAAAFAGDIGMEVRGAQAVLDEIRLSGTAGAPDAAYKENPRALLKADLERYRKESSAMSSEEAAKSWLGFYDRLTALPPRSMVEVREEALAPADSAPMIGLLLALPGPDSWPALQKLAQARPAQPTNPRAEAVLRMFTAVLNGDAAGADRELALLEKLAQTDAASAGDYDSVP